MKKIIACFILAATSVLALEIMPPDIVVQADGSTNYEGIHCTTEDGRISDGIILKLSISKDITPKWVDLFIITLTGENIACCSIEARDEDDASLYRLDLGKDYLQNSELWVFTDKYGRVNFPLKQFKSTKMANKSSDPT